MILVDPRVGSKDLLPHIQKIGTPCQLQTLEYGDACFEGNGPDMSRVYIGVERKRVGDMLNCIDDARYAAHQRPGMQSMYNKDVLIIEGTWKPDVQSGYMMECVAALTWRPYRYRTQMVRYSKLFRYLLTIQLAGTMVISSRDAEQTAYNITELYAYFQKKWDDHVSLLEQQRLAIPTMNGKPTLVQKWAAAIEGIGPKLCMRAAEKFDSPIQLAKADEQDWMEIEGVGSKLAQKIVKTVNGWED